MKICSFDIGTKNLALNIIDLSEKDVQKLNFIKEQYDLLPVSVKKKEKTNPNGFCEDYIKVLREIYKLGTRVYFGVFDISVEDKDQVYDKIKRKKQVFKFLESKIKYLLDVDIFRVEEQLITNSPRGSNNKAVCVSETVIDFLLLRFPEKDIDFMSSKLKTAELDCVIKFETEKGKKIWSFEKYKEICKLRDDKEICFCFDEIEKLKGKRINDKNRAKLKSDFRSKCNDENANEIYEGYVDKRQKGDDYSDCGLMNIVIVLKKFVKMESY